MPPFRPVWNVVPVLGFFSRQRGLPPIALRSYSTSSLDSKKAIEEVYSNRPASRFSIIDKIPDTLKYGLVEDIHEEVKRVDFNDIIGLITDQKAVKRRGLFIIDTLTKEAKAGNKEAAEMKSVFTDFAAEKITHFHIRDCFPAIDSGLSKHLVNRKFLQKVGIDNEITAPEDSAQKILENITNISFAFSAFYAMGYNYPNQIERPLFCFRTTHPQYPHTDSVTSKQSLALALYGISSDRSVKTYVVDLEQILHDLNPEDIELLQKAVYYIPRGRDAVRMSDGQDTFAILDFKNNRPWARFDGKPDTILVDDALVPDHKMIQEMYHAIEKINISVAKMLQEGKVTNIGLGTGEFLLLNNRRTLHGREDSSRGKDGEYLESDAQGIMGPLLKTGSKHERRVVRCLTGAPPEEDSISQDAKKMATEEGVNETLMANKIKGGQDVVVEPLAANPTQAKPQIR